MREKNIKFEANNIQIKKAIQHRASGCFQYESMMARSSTDVWLHFPMYVQLKEKQDQKMTLQKQRNDLKAKLEGISDVKTLEEKLEAVKNRRAKLYTEVKAAEVESEARKELQEQPVIESEVDAPKQADDHDGDSVSDSGIEHSVDISTDDQHETDTVHKGLPKADQANVSTPIAALGLKLAQSKPFEFPVFGSHVSKLTPIVKSKLTSFLTPKDQKPILASKEAFKTPTRVERPAHHPLPKDVPLKNLLSTFNRKPISPKASPVKNVNVEGPAG